MLAPIRRSLGERILESSRHCRVCIRQLHDQHHVRGPAVAEAQVSEEYIPPLKPRSTSPAKGRPIDFQALQKQSEAEQQRKVESLTSRPKPPSPRISTVKSAVTKAAVTKVMPPEKQTKKSKQEKSPGKASTKAQTTTTAKPAAAETDPSSQFGFDANKVRSTYTAPAETVLPRTLEYNKKSKKGGPSISFQIDYESEALRYLEEGLKMKTKIEFAQLRSGGYRVRLTAAFHKKTAVAMGDGATKQVAADNAALHLLYRDGKQPVFQEPLLLRKVQPLSQNTLRENKSSKVDVYDYAAQFNVLPEFKVIRLPIDSSPNCKEGYFVRVTVKGTDIFGVGFHPSTNAFAEVAACVDFKKRAEEKHQGEKMMVKHINTLTSKTGKKFMEYCKMKLKDWEQYELKSKQINGWEMSAKLYVGDRLVSECVMFTKDDAEAICFYLAARDMKIQDPKLWKNFVIYIHEHAGEILKPITPIGVWMNAETIGALKNRLARLVELERELEAYSKVQQSLSDEVDQVDNPSIDYEPRLPLTGQRLHSKNELLKNRLEKYDQSDDPEIQKMRHTKSELPLNHFADDVKTLFRNNDVCVLVGATGSGKTTQVPQLLLDEAIREGRGGECNIICTQPRRIAAMSVAKRVAAERGERIRESVGYQVRFGYHVPEWGGSITYCTTGILLRQLREGYQTLQGITHVIVDEVHERDVQIDFLMVLLKRILEARRRGETDAPPIKVILMSATIDTTLFRKYFGAAYDNGECPFIEIPGRMFPVQKYYLNDVQTMLNQYPNVKETLAKDDITKNYIAREMEARKDIANTMQHEEEEQEESGIDWRRTGSAWEKENAEMREETTDQPDLLIANTIAHLCSKKAEGAVLVFLPGIREIISLDKVMKSSLFLGQDFANESQYRIFMLHSSIPTMQQDVFNPIPGVRKIILSTNIAETSVTIPEVVYVVDTCKHRETRYSQLRRSTALVCTWISQSSARQRAGRAGRVTAGEYYALVTPERHSALPVGENAEIKRSDLQEVCLDVRSYGIKDPIANVLEECIEPPSSLAVVTALRALRSLGALDDDEQVTPLGSILAQLPVSPALGKMVLLGCIFKCLDPILILAAVESGRNFFVNPPGSNDRSKDIRYSMSLAQPSDHLALLNAYREWRFIKNSRGRIAANEYAFENLMHVGGLSIVEKTSEQLLQMLVEWNLAKDIRPSMRYNNELGDPHLNLNSDVQPLVFALLTAGLMPNLAVQTTPVLLQTSADPKALIHPGSLNNNSPSRSDSSSSMSRSRQRYLGAGPPGTIVLYSNKATNQGGVFLRDTSVIGPVTGLMFSGKLEVDDERSNTLQVDDWLPFKFETGVVRPLNQFITCVESFLERTWNRLKVLNANKGRGTYPDGATFYDADPSRDPIVKSVVEILERCEHLDKLRRKVESQEFAAKQARFTEFNNMRSKR